MTATKFQVVRNLPNLIQLVGEYENIHQAKFIMQKAKVHAEKHNGHIGKYVIQSITRTN